MKSRTWFSLATLWGITPLVFSESTGTPGGKLSLNLAVSIEIYLRDNGKLPERLSDLPNEISDNDEITQRFHLFAEEVPSERGGIVCITSVRIADRRREKVGRYVLLVREGTQKIGVDWYSDSGVEALFAGRESPFLRDEVWIQPKVMGDAIPGITKLFLLLAFLAFTAFLLKRRSRRTGSVARGLN